MLEHIRQHKTNPRYLRDVHFYTNNLKLSDDINTVVSEADVLILAVPSVYLKTTLEPLTVSLQDKFVMHQENLLHYFELLNHNLKKEIGIGYHSHNNFQLAYSNSIDHNLQPEMMQT